MIAIIKREWKRFLIMVLVLMLATALGYGFMVFHVQETNIVLVYVLAVLLIAWSANSFL